MIRRIGLFFAVFVGFGHLGLATLDRIGAPDPQYYEDRACQASNTPISAFFSEISDDEIRQFRHAAVLRGADEITEIFNFLVALSMGVPVFVAVVLGARLIVESTRTWFRVVLSALLLSLSVQVAYGSMLAKFLISGVLVKDGVFCPLFIRDQLVLMSLAALGLIVMGVLFLHLASEVRGRTGEEGR